MKEVRLGGVSAKEARSRFLLSILGWSAIALIVVGFIVAREIARARAQAADLDRVVAELRAEVESAKTMEARAASMRGELAALQAERATLAERVPCALDTAQLVAIVRERVEPLGATLRPEMGFVAPSYDSRWDDHAVPIVLPDRPGVEDEVRRELAKPGLILRLSRWSDDPHVRVVSAPAWRNCIRGAPRLASHRARTEEADKASWPFDARVRGVKKEIAALESERRAHEDVLRLAQWIELQKMENERVRAAIAVMTR